MTRLHNPGPYEVVYDSVGHMLGGGESIDVPVIDPMTASLIEAGRLIVVDTEPSLVGKKRPPKTPPPAVDTFAADKKKEDR